MSVKNNINLKLYSLNEIKEYFYKNKLENLILFSQARSGTTFVSNVLANELNFGENCFFEEFFSNKHFTYIKKFVDLHNNFFINTNEFVYRRTELKKEKTLHLYLFRDHTEILNSYKKAKEKSYYLGWEELYNKYRVFFPNLEKIQPITLFNHKVWEQQIEQFEHGLTISYDSFRAHPKFIKKEERDKKITTLKQIEKNKDGWSEYSKNHNLQKTHFKKILKFTLFHEIYFKIRRFLESRKRNRKNY